MHEEDEPEKCNQCDCQSLSGPGALGFHKKWIYYKVRLIFKGKECEFDSISVSALKKLIVPIHKVHGRVSVSASACACKCTECVHR